MLILSFVPLTILSNSLEERHDSLFISQIIYNVFTDNYDEAYKICDYLIKTNPDDPSGYFFKAYSLMAEMTEKHENLHQDKFFELLDSVEIAANKLMDTCQIDCKAWCQWYIGNVWAYRSLWKARFGSFIAAYKLSSKAGKKYKLGLSYDSSLYDLYAGLGAYHYWKSAKAGFLRKIRLFKDERKKGIEELRLAADYSLISRETAKKTLITIYNDYKQYDSAIIIAEDMLEKYPNGVSFLWGMSWAYYYKKDYSRACDYFVQLRNQLTKNSGNYYKIIICDAQITRCYEQLKMKIEAKEWANHLNNYYDQISVKVHSEQKKNIKYLKKMMNH